MTPTHAVAHDHTGLFGPMIERMVRLGRSLTPAQWGSPSLCTGWRVCDVYGHMTYGGATPMHRVLPVLLLRYRGNLTKGSMVESIRYARARTQEEVLTEFERSSHHPVGIGKRIKPAELHLDHVVHELDIRRPLGLASQLTPADLTAALDSSLVVSSPLFAPKKTAAGIRLVASDLEWSGGPDGAPVVGGPAEDLLLALAGRPAGLAALRGDGLAELTRRISAA